MARQPIEKLQGYGQISSPSATPIDSYTGSPQVDRNTPLSQLAQALNVVGGDVARAGAGAAAEAKRKKKEDADKLVPEYIAQTVERYKIEKLEDIPSKIQLEEDGFLPEDSHLVMNSITEGLAKKFGKNWFISQIEGERDSEGDFIEGSEGLPNDIRYDRDSLITWIADKQQELRDIVGDKPFVAAGALRGFDAAAGTLTQNAEEQRKVRDKELDLSLATDAVKDSFANADSAAEAVDLIDLYFKERKQHGSIAPTKLKEHMVQAAVAYSLKTYDENVLDALEAGGFGGGASQKFIDQARLNIPALQIQHLTREIELEKLQYREELQKGRGKINELVVNNDIDALEEHKAELAMLSADSPMHQTLYSYLQQEESNAALPVDVVKGVITQKTQDLLFAVTTGDYSKLGLPEDKQNLTGIIEWAENLEGTTATARAGLIAQIPKLMEGYDWVNNHQSNRDYENAFRSQLQLLTGDELYDFLTEVGISAETEVRETYTNTLTTEADMLAEKLGEKPGPTDMNAARAKAREAAQRKLEQLKSLMDGKGDDEAEIKRFLEQKQAPQYEVGQIVNDEKTNQPIARVTGFDVNGNPQFEPIEPEETIETEEPEVIEEASSLSQLQDVLERRDPERDEYLRELVTTIYKAENDPSVRVNKRMKNYQLAEELLKAVPKEELDAFVNPLAEQALVYLEDLANPESEAAVPYTKRGEVKELIALIKKNPASVFDDNKYTKRFLDTVLK